MSISEPLNSAFSTLSACDETVAKLDSMCCAPGRSPRMKALSKTLGAARKGLAAGVMKPDAAEQVLTLLEDAGAQVGRLQVGCCAPKRLPLYAEILEGLTTAQLTIKSEVGSGH